MIIYRNNNQIEEKGKELRQKIESQGINDAFIETKKQLSSSKLQDMFDRHFRKLSSDPASIPSRNQTL